MITIESTLYPEVKYYLEAVENDFASIPNDRRQKLNEIAGFISTLLATRATAKVVFICTHNSRRSQLSQVWAAAAAEYYNLADRVESYSGGTQVTAFNIRAVEAIRRAGLRVARAEGENPHYQVRMGPMLEPLFCYSKEYDHAENPQQDFVAVMTCSEADSNCPIVHGAGARFSLPYVDPKLSDGTQDETEVYDERCRQIATEVSYLMSLVKA